MFFKSKKKRKADAIISVAEKCVGELMTSKEVFPYGGDLATVQCAFVALCGLLASALLGDDDLAYEFVPAYQKKIMSSVSRETYYFRTEKIQEYYDEFRNAAWKVEMTKGEERKYFRTVFDNLKVSLSVIIRAANTEKSFAEIDAALVKLAAGVEPSMEEVLCDPLSAMSAKEIVCMMMDASYNEFLDYLARAYFFHRLLEKETAEQNRRPTEEEIEKKDLLFTDYFVKCGIELVYALVDSGGDVGKRAQDYLDGKRPNFPFGTDKEIDDLEKYMSTAFVYALIYYIYTGQHATPGDELDIVNKTREFHNKVWGRWDEEFEKKTPLWVGDNKKPVDFYFWF